MSGSSRSTPSISSSGNAEPDIDDDDVLAAFEDGHILADFADPAEKDDSSVIGICFVLSTPPHLLPPRQRPTVPPHDRLERHIRKGARPIRPPLPHCRSASGLRLPQRSLSHRLPRGSLKTPLLCPIPRVSPHAYSWG